MPLLATALQGTWLSVEHIGMFRSKFRYMNDTSRGVDLKSTQLQGATTKAVKELTID